MTLCTTKHYILITTMKYFYLQHFLKSKNTYSIQNNNRYFTLSKLTIKSCTLIPRIKKGRTPNYCLQRFPSTKGVNR